MPHVPLYVSDKFKGKSKQGLYGDVIMEIDWSVGQILKTLKAEGLDENTVVLFTSDNGPWLSYGNHAGSTGPLREGKGTPWEGGQRVPCIARWPGRIQAGSVCKEPAMHIDLFPTIAAMLETGLPAHGVDGKDIGALFTTPDKAKSPHEAYYLYYNDVLCFVRSESWTLAMPHQYRTLKGEPGSDGIPGPYQQAKTGLALYDLKADIGQTNDVSKQHPEVTARLKRLGEVFNKNLRANRRQPGQAQ
jgi:arylsulfatase A-like enzyme